MAYIGKVPTAVPLTSSDIEDGTIALADLSATGTKDATTFLRGDNTFATAGGDNTPAFSVGLSANQTISNAAFTKIQYNLEFFDTDNAYDNSTNYRFTVPTGKAGKYFLTASVRNTSATDFDAFYLQIKKNGSDYLLSTIRSEFRETTSTTCIVDLAAADYLEVEAYNGSGGNLDLSGSSDKPSATHFSGFRLIG